MAPPPTVAFLSDYGAADGFVGVCHLVIAAGCPSARVVDLSHGIPRHDVRAGAVVLARAVAVLPAAAVVLADVAGEEGARDVAVLTAAGHRFVGPDNGLLAAAAHAAGGARDAVDLRDSPAARSPVSPTFHGRDVLAPVAAALAGGAGLADLGAPVDPRTLTVPEASHAHREGGALITRVLAVDGFGNLELDAAGADLDGLGGLGVTDGGRLDVRAETEGGAGAVLRGVRRGRGFADVAPGEPVLYVDPEGRLALAVNRDSARTRLGLEVGAVLRISAS